MVDPAVSESLGSWPAPVVPLLAQARVCEFASVTRRGTPVTWPVTPYLSADRRSIGVTTGVAWPAKAERARRNAKVSLLFADHGGVKLATPPVVLVRGLATVRDRDLQANTDRYLTGSFDKLGGAYPRVPWGVVAGMRWFWVRIWIEVTPVEIVWWPRGVLDDEPRRWKASTDVAIAKSDAAPEAHHLPPWQPAPQRWREEAVRCISNLGKPDLTVMDEAGWPLPLPMKRVKAAPDGFRLTPFDGIPSISEGPACLTFHRHDDTFSGHESFVFIGSAVRTDAEVHFRVERRLGDFSVPQSSFRRRRRFRAYGRQLGPRLEHELDRRAQPMPELRKPPTTPPRNGD